MGEMVRYGSGSEGYLALPVQGSGPAVVVIQEWWGLVPHIKEVAERFAHHGFVALAPDLYQGAHTTEPDEARRLAMGLEMDEAGRTVAEAAAHLVGLPQTTGERVGAVGFCFGGSLALWSATLSPHVVATAAFYPAVPWERMRPQWDNYAGRTALIHCSEEDGTSAAPGIQQARRAIEEAGGKVSLHDYPGTRHAFFNDDRPEVYDAVASATAWERTTQFLHDRLSG